MEMWSGMEGDGHGRCAPLPFWCPPILVSLFCLGRRNKSITTVSTTGRGHKKTPLRIPQHQNALRDTCLTAKINMTRY